MKNTDVAVDDRVDISSVKIDADAPVTTRAEEYLRQIKNPYAFKCGKIAINLRFSPEGKPLREALASYLCTMKKNN